MGNGSVILRDWQSVYKGFYNFWGLAETPLGVFELFWIILGDPLEISKSDPIYIVWNKKITLKNALAKKFFFKL